jgi:hypothetical protein
MLKGAEDEGRLKGMGASAAERDLGPKAHGRTFTLRHALQLLLYGCKDRQHRSFLTKSISESE